MQRTLMMALGVALMVAGLLMSPLPIPFPIGLVTFLAGCAVLTSYSKGFRRFIQYLRHRNTRLSRSLEFASKRAPVKVKRMVHQTRPGPLSRHARLRGRHGR